MRSKQLALSVAVVALMAPSLKQAVAAPLYRETFPNLAVNPPTPTLPGSNNRTQGLVSQGWTPHVDGLSGRGVGGTGGTIFGAADSAIPGGDIGEGVSNNPNFGTNADNPNERGRGMMFFSRQRNTWGLETGEVGALNLQAQDVKSLRLAARNNDGPETGAPGLRAETLLHPMIKVEGQWWVSENAVGKTTGETAYEELTVSIDGGRWAPAEFALEGAGPDGDLTTREDNIPQVATLTGLFSAPKPDGVIEAAGLFAPELQGNARIDLFELSSAEVAAPVRPVLGNAERDDGRFTVAMLPDSQKYLETQSLTPIFDKQIETLVENADTLDLAFVTHVGDVIQTASVEREFRDAGAIMQRLDAAGVPYGVVLGNHDLEITSDKASGSAGFVDTFGSARYAGEDWYGGADPTQENHYQIFEGEGFSFLNLSLEWRPESESLAWAQGVLDANPTLPAILSTHEYLSSDGRSGAGDLIWDGLVKDNDQIFMVLSGHLRPENRQISVNNEGNEVFEMLANFQDDRYGGAGWMRLLEFDLKLGRIDVSTYSVLLNAFATDADSAFSLPINFQQRFAGFNESFPAPIPAPAALPLMLSAFAALGFAARRARRA